MTEDLWPAGVLVSSVRSPLLILREQASLLSSKTARRLLGDIETSPESNDGVDTMRHRFMIVTPLLDNYRYELFSVSHRRDLVYPAEFYGEASEEPVSAANEEECVRTLRFFLGHSSTKSVVHSLIARVTEGQFG